MCFAFYYSTWLFPLESLDRVILEYFRQDDPLDKQKEKLRTIIPFFFLPKSTYHSRRSFKGHIHSIEAFYDPFSVLHYHIVRTSVYHILDSALYYI